MSKPWVCIGHSHTNALVLADDPEVAIVDLRIGKEAWIEGCNPWRLHDDLARRVRSGQAVFLLVGGGESVMLSQLEYVRRFDLILPSNPDLPLDTSREIVPADALSRRLTEASAGIFDCITGIVGAADGPVTLIHPPPPVGDAEAILPHLNLDPAIFTIAAKWVRYKLWRLHCELIEAACRAQGIAARWPPRGALDNDGFLHSDFQFDTVHGNGAYGRHVLEDLRGAGLMAAGR